MIFTTSRSRTSRRSSARAPTVSGPWKSRTTALARRTMPQLAVVVRLCGYQPGPIHSSHPHHDSRNGDLQSSPGHQHLVVSGQRAAQCDLRHQYPDFVRSAGEPADQHELPRHQRCHHGAVAFHERHLPFEHHQWHATAHSRIDVLVGVQNPNDVPVVDACIEVDFDLLTTAYAFTEPGTIGDRNQRTAQRLCHA